MFAFMVNIFLSLQFLSTHFIISYPENIGINKIVNIANYLEDKHNILSGTWKLRREKKIEIVIYSSTEKFTRFSNSHPMMSGKYMEGKIHLQPLPLLERRKILFPTLAHELVHAFLDDFSKEGLPRWLNESFAVYFSDVLERYHPSKKIRLNHLEDLEIYLLNNDAGIKNTVYFYSGLTMQFFIVTFPHDQIVTFLKSFHPDVSDPYLSSFNLSKQEVEKKWKEYLKRF